MKLSQLKRLILETLEEEVEPQYEVYDDLGKFYQVKRPAVGMTKEDMVCEVTAFDEINKDCWLKCILEIYAIWINENGFGLFIRPILLSFKPSMKISYNYFILKNG